jgi:predicted double-glycine peptidase
MFQLLAVIPLAAIGVWLGRTCGNSARWAWSFLLPLIAVVLVILGRRSAQLCFMPPVSWAVDARIEPLMMAVAVPCLLGTLIARLPRQNLFRRCSIIAFMVLMVVYYAVLPPLCPLLVRGALAAGQTQIDDHGVCRQTHAYTCGPASAVTCLHALGVDAAEGPLAIDAGCGPLVGTSPTVLAAVLGKEFGPAGIQTDCRYLGSLNELSTPAIVEIFLPNLVGHYVAVLEIGSDQVVVGDPLAGVQRMSRAEFLAEWKHTAILVSRNAGGKPL